MRTTLQIDDDLIETARAIAERDHRTMGDVVSELMRKGIQAEGQISPRNRLGLPVLPARGLRKPVTLEFVNRLRDELP